MSKAERNGKWPRKMPSKRNQHSLYTALKLGTGYYKSEALKEVVLSLDSPKTI